MENEIESVNEAALSKYFIRWTKQIDTNKREFWSKNIFAKELKQYLISVGRWRNKKRGNPKKGYLTSLNNGNNITKK